MACWWIAVGGMRKLDTMAAGEGGVNSVTVHGAAEAESSISSAPATTSGIGLRGNVYTHPPARCNTNTLMYSGYNYDSTAIRRQFDCHSTRLDECSYVTL